MDQSTVRRAEYAEMRALAAEQRAAMIEAQASQLQAVAMMQHLMLAQQAQAQAMGAPPAAPAQPASVLPLPGPRPLLDVAGAPMTTTGYGPVGDIVGRVEAYLGRPLSGPERMVLGQMLRRPRSMDTADPWVRLQ